jgi:hypothetical protein
MGTNEKDCQDPDDDRVIYIPSEEYHRFMQSFYKLEEAQNGLHKLRDSFHKKDESDTGVQFKLSRN